MAVTNMLPLAGRCILIVEDEYFQADDITQVLVAAGASVLGPINQTQDALRAIQENTAIDGAILDINVQGIMVFEVADELKRRAIPFVFATGYDHAAIPLPYADVRRWEKPFDPHALARSLPQILWPAL